MKEKQLSDAKRFLLTLLATTFSIILTFGTSAIIERRHKAAAKKEMAMSNRCAQMMKVSEEDLKEFSRLRAVVEDDSEEYDLELKQLSDEYLEAIIIVGQAQKKLEQEKQTIK